MMVKLYLLGWEELALYERGVWGIPKKAILDDVLFIFFFRISGESHLRFGQYYPKFFRINYLVASHYNLIAFNLLDSFHVIMSNTYLYSTSISWYQIISLIFFFFSRPYKENDYGTNKIGVDETFEIWQRRYCILSIVLGTTFMGWW